MITMRARKGLIWLSILVLGIPLAILWFNDQSPAILWFNDLSDLIDQAQFLASALLILSLAVAGWRLKKRLKRRMGQGLGRDVDDIELVSIAQWMRIPDQAKEAAREADQFDFNDAAALRTVFGIADRVEPVAGRERARKYSNETQWSWRPLGRFRRQSAAPEKRMNHMNRPTQQDVVERIKKDFRPEQFGEVMELLEEYDEQYDSNPAFMRLAILTLAKGRKQTLRPMLETALIDSRDIIRTVHDEHGLNWLEEVLEKQGSQAKERA